MTSSKHEDTHKLDLKMWVEFGMMSVITVDRHELGQWTCRNGVILSYLSI